MISLYQVYQVIAATVPLYVAMILAYISVKWWKLFTPDQCSGINKFVAKFSIPLLSFQLISTSNPYKMNIRLVGADALQKILAFLVLAVITRWSSSGNLKWIITGISLSTLPNTLILGIPLIRAMYGDEAAGLLVQIVVLQSFIWYNILLFLFELSATREAYVTPSPEVAELEAAREEQEDEETEGKKRSSGKNVLLVVLLTVGKKLISNPNTHASVAGLIWALIKFRWGLHLPKIADKSITILSDGGLGMAMFSLGLFMASRAGIKLSEIRRVVLALSLKFLAGPAVMIASSYAIGLRGIVLKMAIVQASLPQGIVPFVFAKEYNVHPDILSIGVIYGLLLALPVALAYYFLLDL
ncbi:putative auxin efflux carrier component 8 isoform X2 [Apium graveolens]|uniref:putative auxin efflux carrier component 8 isoform X2 n=1 Tax=Apium graveolens TaxID=4045 RepID=UPI003D7BE451